MQNTAKPQPKCGGREGGEGATSSAQGAEVDGKIVRHIG